MPESNRKADELIGVLNSGASQKEKVDACRNLARVGTREAVPTLAGLLGDEKLAHMARYALEPIPEAAVDDALRAALGKLTGRLLVGVIGSIGVRRDRKAVGPLAKMLGNPDADVTRTAARTLGKIGTSEAAEVLGKALATAGDDLRPVVADGCLACAEALLAEDKRSEAAAICRSVGKADLPKHFRLAAAQGEMLTR